MATIGFHGNRFNVHNFIDRDPSPMLRHRCNALVALVVVVVIVVIVIIVVVTVDVFVFNCSCRYLVIFLYCFCSFCIEELGQGLHTSHGKWVSWSFSTFLIKKVVLLQIEYVRKKRMDGRQTLLYKCNESPRNMDMLV